MLLHYFKEQLEYLPLISTLLNVPTFSKRPLIFCREEENAQGI
jgi:hypothetical protein